jgi:Ca2+-binding RTX toxin-like protein
MSNFNGDSLGNSLGPGTLFGGNDPDSILGNGGNDSLFGGAANDTLFGGTGADSMFGGSENDSLFGEDDNDSLFGDGGDDSLVGGAGSDRVFGGLGNDLLFENDQTEDDLIDGGAGSDTVSFAGFGVGVNYNLVNGNATFNPPGAGNVDSLVGIEHMIGSGNADTLGGDSIGNFLAGEGGDDSISGNAGNDSLFGGAGADRLFGGDGNDLLDGGDLNDSLSGGAGNDSLLGGDGADSLLGVEGNDTLFGGAGADTLSGGIDADSLSGGGGGDSLVGGSGADSLAGGGGADTIFGGVGSDWVDYGASTAGVNVNLADNATEQGGDAQGDSITGVENVIGSNQADSITGTNASNILVGGGGSDSITGGYGSDSISGGDGDDTIEAGPDTPPTATTPPNQNLTFDWTSNGRVDEQSVEAGFTDTIGGAVQVEITYTENPAGSAFSIEDTDTIYQFAGQNYDTTSSAYLGRPGGAGLTEMSMNFSPVPASGYADEVTNVTFAITDIDTGDFIDQVTILAFDANGNPVPVTISEFNANPELNIVGNTVTATGNGTTPSTSDGAILIQIAGPVASIVIQYRDLANGDQAIRVSDVQFTAVGVTPENADADTVDGGLGNDLIQGGLGTDSLVGGAGNDSLLGEADHDTLDGGTGNDSLDGGAGNDRLDGGADNDTLLGDVGDDTLFGGGENDSVSGGAGNDSLVGDGGDDTLLGGLGDDTLLGGLGNDSLLGEAGNDILSGGDGDDSIIGGAGVDSMSGGDGNDRFIYGLSDFNLDSQVADNDTIDGGGSLGASTLVDFDTIDLTPYGWARVDIVYTGGNPASEAGTVFIYAPDGTTLIGTITFTEIEQIIPCFTPGTMILTDRGEVAVEALQPGDLVVTRDNGLQPLRWVGQRKLSHLQLVADPDLQPVRIAQGALAGQGPARTMLVSPQHRVLVEGARAELLFGEAEVLVPARHLVGQTEVTRALPEDGVTYVHILFDRHEIVQSDGIWTESFQPAERMLNAMDHAVRSELMALFPELGADATAYAGARLSLKAHEARVLLAG